MRLTFAVALAFCAQAASAADAPFLFDALRRPEYRSAWDRLVKEVSPTPDWLVQFSKNFDGAASQMTAVTIEGKPFELYYVCKPGECAAHKFEVLFDLANKHAYGALGGKDNSPGYFGAPTPAMQEALSKALKG